ncbi:MULTISPECIES: DUF3180 domain-containing protein [Corynebacterium]|uniref:DUF3180 domain-containing protein n=2 Tax=Corynebacterium glucuronolyticum TaxID=39791 RepID=A0A7T4EGZ2_9CORY|nr:MULTISPECIES: DUF3180 domain-containing protein [Corynebacterium]EEI26029.1 hypothetical protein HMPREF0294_2494 [Corynebacterium glucuronolyticum ATCC 51867]EEI64164.1 hypothetical protein HMPREF0293_0251 [Corynebacterium glucuronolyticum ATCC 51866]OFO46304.1 hypothetical protein HMPREF3044_10705 [Corynebacterium sp. HMSC073D01]QQB47179.1 DUF3180 domain-containing protein [Corynebacterium glucuronolyticum]QRO82498.1 DUF3180 domain-containing protein [Corynebacterium glucuronolyticum]
MNLTDIRALIATGGFFAAAAAILTWRFYGAIGGFSAAASVTLWAIAALCGYLGWRVRRAMKDDNIGQDRSQLNPVTAAQWLVIGKTSAWTGGIVGGAYVGVLIVLLFNLHLASAVDDLPGVIVSTLGGLAASAAGLYLERGCHIPPASSAEGA